MSLHSFSRCWIHLIWTTLDREPMLNRPAAVKVSLFLKQYAVEKSIYLKINYVNPDHVHALIDLPTAKSIKEIVQLFKGSSSHWINQNRFYEAGLHGDGVTERFPCLTRTSIELPPMLLAKKNIIERNRSGKRLNCS